MKLFPSKKLIVYIGAACLLYVVGCVNVNNSNVSTVDIKSPVKFVNLVNLGSSPSVSVDGVVVSTDAYGNASAYQDLASGARKVIFSYGSVVDTVPQNLLYETKYTEFSVYEPSARASDTTREHFLVEERNTYGGSIAFWSDSVTVRFIDFSSDTAGALSQVHFMLVSMKPDSSFDTTDVPLSYKGVTSYVNKAVVATPKFYVVDGNGATLVSTASISPAGRYSVVLFGLKSASTIQAKVFKED